MTRNAPLLLRSAHNTLCVYISHTPSFVFSLLLFTDKQLLNSFEQINHTTNHWPALYSSGGKFVPGGPCIPFLTEIAQTAQRTNTFYSWQRFTDEWSTDHFLNSTHKVPWPHTISIQRTELQHQDRPTRTIAERRV